MKDIIQHTRNRQSDVSSANSTAAKLGSENWRTMSELSATRNTAKWFTPLEIRVLKLQHAVYHSSQTRGVACGMCHPMNRMDPRTSKVRMVTKGKGDIHLKCDRVTGGEATDELSFLERMDGVGGLACSDSSYPNSGRIRKKPSSPARQAPGQIRPSAKVEAVIAACRRSCEP